MTHTSDIPTQKYYLSPHRSVEKKVMVNEYMIIDKGGLYVQEDTVISDKDEMVGKEHEDGMWSPPKGSGVHITSEVSYQIL